MIYVGLRVQIHNLDDGGATVDVSTPRQLAEEVKSTLLARYGLPFASSVEVEVFEHTGLCGPDCGAHDPD